MAGECVMKEGKIGGDVLDGNCVGGGVVGDQGKDDEMTEEGMEEVFLPPVRCEGEAVVLVQGAGGRGDAEEVFLDVCEEEMAPIDEGVDGNPVLDSKDERCSALQEGNDSGPSSKAVLDWRRAVLGSGGREEISEKISSGRVEQEVSGEAASGLGNGGFKYGPFPSGKEKEHVWISNHCRSIVFHTATEVFLEEDGVTVNMDEVAASDCERRLGRALVGKILGRTVPFGFLNRDLRRKWGKFGKIQMSLIGRNCFVCFFESEVIRDSVLKGGPWFVGNQLIGVDRWTMDFDPTSIKGFSSPIWIRFPGLSLHYWSDINLGRIASMVGEPLWVDDATAFWGRTEFARVCVRLPFDKKLSIGDWVKGAARKFFNLFCMKG